ASGSLPASGAVPDLKAALIVLRQALAASLADVTVTAAASGAADTAQQGTAASAAPPGTVSTEGPTQGAATLPGIRTATGVPETASPSIPLTQVPQPSAQPSVSPLVIIAGAETGLIESPAIAPQPASDAPRLTTSARHAAPETAQEILAFVSSSQILNSFSAPADAAARSAASS